MAGLLQAGMNQQAQSQPQQPPEALAQGAPLGGPPPPEPSQPPQQPQNQPTQGNSQAMVEALTSAMLGALYEKSVTQGVVDILERWDNPVEAMGRAIHNVMMVTVSHLEQQGRGVPPDVMLSAGVELARGIGEMAIELGEVNEQDELAIEMGLFIALAMVGDDMQGEQAEQYRQLAQRMAEQRMSMIDPGELDQETLALMQQEVA